MKKRLPRVFLAHSYEDHRIVERIAFNLRERGIDVWFDEWEIKVGDSLHDKIERGIRGSGYLIVFLSSHSVKSPWVKSEVNASLTIELRKHRVFVLPALIEDCEIPLFLQDKKYADFRENYQQGLEELLAQILPQDADSSMLKNIDNLERQLIPAIKDGVVVTAYDINRIFQAVNYLEKRLNLDITTFSLMYKGQIVSVRHINQLLEPITRIRNSAGFTTTKWKHHPVKPRELYTAAHLNEICGSVNEVIRILLSR